MVECFHKYIITFIYFLCLIVIAGVSIIIIFTTKDEKKNRTKRTSFTQKEINNLTVIKKDDDLVKPYCKLNAEFELVEIGNGMNGLLISDPSSLTSHIQIHMKYGAFIDTTPGISHFGEHMIFQGSENYEPIYPIVDELSGMKGSIINAYTGGYYQAYFITLNYNFQFEKALDLITDAFRYPLYLPSIIEKEIEVINNEFYYNFHSYITEFDIIRQLASNKTSFHGTTDGNNETLKVNESELLSKKLKGYHMAFKNPKNLFFVMQSNNTLNESEEYAKKYMNYKMHEFSDNEIDKEDKKQLEENVKKIESIEIFDSNIYKHGIYFNSFIPNNTLHIYFHLGNTDFKGLKFDILEYYSYLFNSKYLLDILRDKHYIEVDKKITINRLDTYNYIKNNDFIYLELNLTENGLKEINDIILIINKYIDIMKEEGYKKDYYINFIHYMNNKEILLFTKSNLLKFDSYIKLFSNHLLFEQDKILTSGEFAEENYNENILRKHLNNINYEKSFYTLNIIKNLTELNHLNNVLNSPEKVKLNYHNVDFILGEIPDSLNEQIKNESLKIENLKIREINDYLSQKYNEKVIPCYKEEKNNCEEKNEFDYENEISYKGTQLEEDDKKYVTFYQIDKSSESLLVYSMIMIKSNAIQGLTDTMKEFVNIYIKYILSELLEIENTISFSLEKIGIGMLFKFIAFSDNIVKITKRLIDLIIEEPNDKNFEYSKIMYINSLKAEIDDDFSSYIFNVFTQFINEGNLLDINNINNSEEGIEIEQFKNIYLEIFNNINLINFRIAGNIDQNIVRTIHNYIKQKINNNINKRLLKKSLLQNNQSSYVINYYQKSTMDMPENGIIVAYEIPQQYISYFNIFVDCFKNIAFKYLRFNYSDSYSPSSLIYGKYFVILMKGLYKDVDKMEDDINKVLLDVLEGKITIKNYDKIRESHSLFVLSKQEKNLDSLFNGFIVNTNIFGDNTENEEENEEDFENKENKEIEEDKEKEENEEKEKEENKENENYENIIDSDDEIPKTFSELVEHISPVFINPKRFTILIAKNSWSNETFQNMFKKRSEIKKYFLNNNIDIIHTDDINYKY